MGSEAQRPGRSGLGKLRYSRVGLCLMLGLLMWCSGCGSMSTSGPPPGPPVDVNLTLALSVTDADGNPLEALVTVIVYEGLGADQTVHQWNTSTSPVEQTVGCIAGDPAEDFTWEFNGFWADFRTISVRQQELWAVEVTVTKTGYRPYYEDWTVFYEWVRDSGCYGMWWIQRMQEVTP
ncbi:MAG: hypothetical protein KAW89_05680 [Armatimonadetes bacterium]|nr:hypothetical protein [Armatimonadota bacterium]